MSQARICVVDGTFELFRSFFGARSKKAPDGREVGATVSLARSLHALAGSGEFSHLAVAYDSVIESFRNKLFDGYKTGEGIEPELFAQFPLIEEVTQALGISVLSMVEFEADDGLASVAAQWGARDDVSDVVIASPDKDLAQCVRGNVITWDRMREKKYDRDGVFEKMGVPPESIPDYLALVGDTADGIPGVPRWGARSTSAVLTRYGHLEQIPRQLSEWDIKVRGAAGLLENLKGLEEEVLLYRKLATLREDVPLEVSFEEARYEGPDQEAVERLSESLGARLIR